MIAHFFFVLSFLVLALIFFKRFRQMVRDQELQRRLFEEEEVPKEIISEDWIEPEEVASLTLSPTQLKALLGEAEKALSQGNLHQAQEFYLQILEADPLHPEALLAMGNLSIHFENFPQAEYYLSKLVPLKKDANAFSMLGICLYHQNRLVESAEAYENAISLDPNKSARHSSLGQIYTELGEHEKALKAYENALARSPKDKELLYNLAVYYESLRLYKRASELSQDLIHLFGKEPGFVELQSRCKEGLASLKSETDPL